jgi:hypothetical protein
VCVCGGYDDEGEVRMREEDMMAVMMVVVVS